MKEMNMFKNVKVEMTHYEEFVNEQFEKYKNAGWEIVGVYFPNEEYAEFRFVRL